MQPQVDTLQNTAWWKVTAQNGYNGVNREGRPFKKTKRGVNCDIG